MIISALVFLGLGIFMTWLVSGLLGNKPAAKKHSHIVIAAKLTNSQSRAMRSLNFN